MATQQYTNDQIRSAMHRAADFIEANPKRYDFGSISVPLEGECGCMVGWLGAELGMKRGETYVQHVSIAIGKAKPGEVTNTEQWLYDFGHLHASGFTASPVAAAACLRAYADKYFPATAGTTPALDSAYLAFRAAFTTSMEAA